MIKVYCDTGGFTPNLQTLENKGKVCLIMFPYENINRSIGRCGAPSKAQWNDMHNFTWDTVPDTWDDYKGSEKYKAISHIVGAQNRRDLLHIDSAFKSGCSVFFSRDSDVLSKKHQLEQLLDMKILHPNKDWKKFQKMIDDKNRY